MALSDPTVDRIEAGFRELVHEVNATSAATRAGWLFFLALLAYFFLTLAGIDHRQLLLDAPVTLPVLQAQASLTRFFLFGPLVPLLVHMGVLIQHVQLARQCRELHRRVAIFEGTSLLRAHRMRLHLSSYFFTQLIAGGPRASLFAFFLALMAWLTLGILPVILLLDFQTSFLPFHDLGVTWAHRGYVVADIVLLTIFAIYMRYPAAGFLSGFGSTIVERPFSVLAGLVLTVGAMFFSLSVATIPDERMDRAMTGLLPARVPFEDGELSEPRQAFLPTAFLFERGVDPLSGRPLGFFARNLIVPDADLTRGGAAAGPGAPGVNLRRRDLRFAVLDRSDLRNADLTGAVLSGASLRETNLTGARAEKAVLRGADLWRAKFLAPAVDGGGPVAVIDLRAADLRGANLSEANLQGVDVASALFDGTDLRAAQMDADDAAEAARQGAKF